MLALVTTVAHLGPLQNYPESLFLIRAIRIINFPSARNGSRKGSYGLTGGEALCDAPGWSLVKAMPRGEMCWFPKRYRSQ
jgi:hypothetical protein